MNKRPQVKGGNAQGGHGDNNVVAPQQYACALHKMQGLFHAAAQRRDRFYKLLIFLRIRGAKVRRSQIEQRDNH
jgi:hypothetical protein